MLAETRGALARYQFTLAAHLAQAGAPDLAALEAGVEQRRQIEGQLAEVSTRLLGLAPDGLDALCAQRAAATEAVGDVCSPPKTSSGEIEAETAALVASLAEAERALEPVQKELGLARETLARLAAEADATGRRQAELLAKVPPSGTARNARSEALAAAVAGAGAVVNRTVRDLAAWSDHSLDAAALDALQQACNAAETAVRAADAELARIRTEAARLEGALTEARNEDVATRAEQLAREVERLQGDVRRFEEEVAALQLLDSELALEEARTREQFLAPVMARLGPYLETLFPAAQVSFDKSFAPSVIERNSVREQLARMSDGTQEQIAVLVRLAFARLFADTGSSVPLILDDALVYSDDQRIAAMFRVLEAAAEQHQVIVLTCRTLAFAGLKGRRLTLEPWSRAAAAAA